LNCVAGAVLAVIALLGCAGQGAQAAASNSVAYQIDAAHDGAITFAQGFHAPLKRAWIRDLGGPVSYPLIAENMVFVTVGDGADFNSRLFAIDLNTGETIWEKLINGLYGWSNAAFDAGRIFVINDLGALQAFSANRSGKALWNRELDFQGYFSAPPTAQGGQLYIGGNDHGGTLWSIAEKNGATTWAASVMNGDDSSPALGSGGVYVAYPCQYYKFDLATGHTIWNTSTGCEGGGGATPVYFDNRVFVRDTASGNVVLNSFTGGIMGPLRADAAPAFWTSAGGEHLELALYGGRLNAVDLDSGAVVWTFGGIGKLSISPIVVNDVVVIGSEKGKLYVLDAASGSTLWSDKVGAPIKQSGAPITGLGAGLDTLVVPASNLLAAYVQE
jgi:outer membrane protein assembly factor BamB